MITRCKYCSKPIEWADIEGRRLPLDSRAPVYAFIDGAWKKTGGYVLHTWTCVEQIKQQPARETPDEYK